MSLRLSPLIDDAVSPAIGAYPTNESERYHIGMDSFKRLTQDRIYASNRWYGRRVFSQSNFFFPLFSTIYENWFTLLYAEKENKDYYKEFIYEILKRSEPKLLDIPSVGDSLPQVNVELFMRIIDSKYHKKESFLWDYNYVRNNQKPVLIKKLKELNEDEKSFLELSGLNELDYFFNREIGNIIKLYNRNQINLKECFKKLFKERFSSKYPKNRSMMTMTKKIEWMIIFRRHKY